MARILIAEDEPDIRELVSITLTFGGFEVIKVSNGQEAVESARSAVPDLILLDVRMPRMTGYEACRALKGDPSTASIPIVFLSAKGQEEEVRDGLKAGAEAYILKPFAPDQLIERVKEHLRAAAEARAQAPSPPPPPAPATAQETPRAAAPPEEPPGAVEPGGANGSKRADGPDE